MMESWAIIMEGIPSPQARFGMQMIQEAAKRIAGYCIQEKDAEGSVIRLRIASGEDGVPEGGYQIQVGKPEQGRQTVRITGYDDTALMYGCIDFAGGYLSQAILSRRAEHPYYFLPLFKEEPLPQTDRVSCPSIRHRGLWTWGLAMYDWRGYLENMAKLRLNELIIWNDFAPLNAREIVIRAHELGIRIIWGYAWGWDVTMKLDVSEAASSAIIDRFEREYASVGGDGIYFQSFTETEEEWLDGRLIAEAVMEFVNRTAERLLQKYPKLRLQFGLHANSVRNRLEYITRVDPRVEIIWENIGDFPWHTMPDRVETPEETRMMTEKILALRPGACDGAVFKSMTQLDWGQFRHQDAPCMLGCAEESLIQLRMKATERIWRYIEGEWVHHGEKCLEAVRCFAAHGNTSLYNLLEDGLFDRRIPLPAALFAECCWDSARSWKDILRECIQRTDIAI